MQESQYPTEDPTRSEIDNSFSAPKTKAFDYTHRWVDASGFKFLLLQTTEKRNSLCSTSPIGSIGDNNEATGPSNSCQVVLDSHDYAISPSTASSVIDEVESADDDNDQYVLPHVKLREHLEAKK